MRITIWYTLGNNGVEAVGFDCPDHLGAGLTRIDDFDGTVTLDCSRQGCVVGSFASNADMQEDLQLRVTHGKPLIEPALRKLPKKEAARGDK